MYATIRRYEGVTGTTDELVRAIRQLGSSLGQVNGFVSCVVLETEHCVLTTVSIFEDHVSLEEAERLIWKSLPEHLAVLLPGQPQVTTGEIVFQKGL